MKKALTDIEILAWNDKLKKTEDFNMFMVNPVYTDKSLYPSIAIREIASLYNAPSQSWGKNLYDNPHINKDKELDIILEYDFSFSLPIEITRSAYSVIFVAVRSSTVSSRKDL